MKDAYRALHMLKYVTSLSDDPECHLLLEISSPMNSQEIIINHSAVKKRGAAR
jgi:hypothetical protein